MGAALLIVGLLWMAGFGFLHFRAVAKAKASESWPTASGRILSCDVIEEESTDREGGTNIWYNPVACYSYAAAGREFQGRRLRFGNYRCNTRKKAEAALAPYPVGATPLVRYNPEKPEESVLETSPPGPIYLILALFGLLFVGFGLLWGLLN